MKSMVIIVNNNFESDPRVTRTVKASIEFFTKITVLSGTPNFRNKKSTKNGKIKVVNYFFYKPNFSKSNLVKSALSIVTSGKKDSDKESTQKNNFFRTFLFIGWLTNILLMNVIIFFRFISLKADLYYANDFDTLWVTFLLGKFHKGKIIYDSHEIYADLIVDSPKIYNKLIRLIEGSLIKKMSAVITVNNPIARLLQERYNLEIKPEVIYNTPYLEIDNSNQNRHINRPFKLLYHGMYLPGRNLEELIHCMKHVSNSHLFLRGFGVLEKNLQDLVLELNVSDKVTFLEPIKMKDMVNQATDFDIGIIPYPGSQKELNSYFCTPNKIFEYMMAGLALAVSDLPVLREIVLKNENGIIFERDNIFSMAENLNKLTSEDLKKMRKNSLKSSRETYNFNHESKKLIGIYEMLFD
jgi:glycosyltransferase involved in cell wall biosynthesis